MNGEVVRRMICWGSVVVTDGEVIVWWMIGGWIVECVWVVKWVGDGWMDVGGSAIDGCGSVGAGRVSE